MYAVLFQSHECIYFYFLIIFQSFFYIKQQQQIAQIYLLFMRRILERDISFISAERMRLQQLLDEKISDQKRKEINQKLNILSGFSVNKIIAPHTEL